MSSLAPPEPPTPRSLLPDARHLILPEGIVSTGYPAVEAACAELGIRFDDWQADLNRCILAKGSDGDYAADLVAMSICRQAGKTYDVGGIVFADSIANPGTTTVWTAHRFPVSRESFEELKGMARLPAMASHVDYDDITTAAGNECIPFRNGSRILFKARERGAIRGFTKVRRIVLDEAQILTESAMADMAPTQNQAVNPQIILMGTPPKPNDPGEVFARIREEALAGEAEGTLYVEFSADLDAEVDDPAAWARANPSFPRRTPAKRIKRLLRLLGEDDFRREGLGIWDPGGHRSIVDLAAWDDLEDKPAKRPAPVAFAVTTSSDRKWSYVSVAGRRADGLTQVQVAKSQRGTGWVVDEVARMAVEWKPVAVAVPADDPASSLVPDIEKKKVDVTLLSRQQYARGCGMFIDGVQPPPAVDDPTAPTIRHGGGQLITVSLGAARWHKVGEAKAFVGPKDGSTDIAPLKGVACALYALADAPEPKRRSGLVVGIR